jgi:hypothetical protein
MAARALVCGGLVALAGLGLAYGCSSVEITQGPADATSGDSSVDARPRDGGGADREPPDPIRPAGLPEGWELERTFDKSCELYTPRSRDLLPPPLRWEPCPDTATPVGVRCALMANEPGVAGFPIADAATVIEGTVTLSAYRTARPTVLGGHWLLADADGVVHSAMFTTVTSPCVTAFPSVFGGHYAVRIYKNRSSYGGGFFAGSVDDLTPRISGQLAPTETSDFYASPFAILQLTTGAQFKQYAWEDGRPLPQLWSAAQDNGLDQGSFSFSNDAMFWAANNLNYHKVKVYTPAGGVRDFLTAGMVTDHGHDDLGTDGQDLVWIEARGRKSGGLTPFDTYDIMTAPYTTEPSAVVPRRLRSEVGPSFGTTPFIVGCGHAVRSTGFHLRIVRLSDGRSWTLDERTKPWLWSTPLALTCTELFTRVAINGENQPRLARVRLDSLGPGIAPD